ncbi:MAG: hypothetical protein KIS81_00665 [Maricaulaceae bacterium]|nr:hypothetical protein [Maricaulaceae bacterium]
MQGRPLLTAAAIAAAVIAGRRFVVHAETEGAAIQASSGDDPIWGVSNTQGAAEGAVCDVIEAGEAILELGGTVAAGDDLTADAAGKGVKADPDPGETVQAGARARQGGAAGDFIRVIVNPYRLATPL